LDVLQWHFPAREQSRQQEGDRRIDAMYIPDLLRSSEFRREVIRLIFAIRV
jgi:hypothetical protein